MSATNGIMITCDRPGCKMFTFEENLFEKDLREEAHLPEGWGTAVNPELVNLPDRTWIFCPDCMDVYRSHWYKFLKIHKERIEEQTDRERFL